MIRFLFSLVFVAVLLGIVAFYLGWFQITKSDDGDKINFGVNVDQDRVRKDLQEAKDKAQEKTRELEDQLKNKTGDKPEKERQKIARP